MTLRSKRSTYPGLYMSSRGFSSMSMGSYSAYKISFGANQALITAVTINKSLLTPVKIDIDPTIQAVRNQEKEQIKGLNNRFVNFIEKVRHLEQQNKLLETKWNMLQGQTATTSNIESMFKSYIANLEKQLEVVNNDKHRLDMESSAMSKQVLDYKKKYEDEINRRSEAETEFVMLKKDVDVGYVAKVDLDNKVSVITDEYNFYKALFDAELHELQESLKETSVLVQMDNSRVLNMDQIVYEVKAQYEEIAARSRKETENWHMKKIDQMTAEADQYGNELHSAKGEISELNRMISRLQNEILTVKTQREKLEAQEAEVEKSGEAAVQAANRDIRDLELALQRDKQDMARQLRDYQDLMNVKLALDIEISTYKKLLEGEEERVGQESIVSIHTLTTKSTPVENTQQRKSGALVIKKVETSNISY